MPPRWYASEFPNHLQILSQYEIWSRPAKIQIIRYPCHVRNGRLLIVHPMTKISIYTLHSKACQLSLNLMVLCIICLLHNLIKQIWLSGEKIKWSSDDRANFVIEEKKILHLCWAIIIFPYVISPSLWLNTIYLTFTPYFQFTLFFRNFSVDCWVPQMHSAFLMHWEQQPWLRRAGKRFDILKYPLA